MNCPKCDADVSDSHQEYDPSVGIMSGGWFCEACDLPISDEDYCDESDFMDAEARR